MIITSTLDFQDQADVYLDLSQLKPPLLRIRQSYYVVSSVYMQSSKSEIRAYTRYRFPLQMPICESAHQTCLVCPSDKLNIMRTSLQYMQ